MSSGRPKRAQAIAGVAAAAAAVKSRRRATSAAAAPAPRSAAGSRQSQRGRVEKKDPFGSVWGAQPKLEPEAAQQKPAAPQRGKRKVGKDATVARASKRQATVREGDDGAQEKRGRARVNVRGSTSPRQQPPSIEFPFDDDAAAAAAAAAAAPRVRLVIRQAKAPGVPRDELKEAGRSGASLKVSKLLSPKFAAKYRFSTFIANLRNFIARHGDELVVPGLLSHLTLDPDAAPDAETKIVRGWRIKFKTDDGAFWLRVYEDQSQSRCYQCSVLRWGAGPRGLATTSKFHVVVVSTAASAAATSPRAAGAAVLSLHGTLHANGVGHLRHVNGKEGGGEHTGTLMMQVWDGLCIALGARMVSVQDVAARSGTYLRFTHAVAHGRTWYGKWEYNFRRGSFGLQGEDYDAAVEGLGAVSLETLGAAFGDAALSRELAQLTKRYQPRKNAKDGYELITTLGQLLRYLMIACRKPPKIRAGSAAAAAAAAEAEALAPHPALTDLYALCSQITARCLRLAGESVDEHGCLVRAPEGSVVRWVTTLLDCKWFAKDYSQQQGGVGGGGVGGGGGSGGGGGGGVESGSPAPTSAGLLRLRCTLREPLKICCPEPRLAEDVFVNESASVGDVLREAAAALQMLYPPLAHFSADTLWVGGEGPYTAEDDEETPIQELLTTTTTTTTTGGGGGEEGEEGRNAVVELGGAGIDMGEPEVDTVRCSCGANDDDGERMLACEDCGIWIHSRCIGLADDEDVDQKFSHGFSCSACGSGGLGSGSGSGAANRPLAEAAEATEAEGSGCRVS